MLPQKEGLQKRRLFVGVALMGVLMALFGWYGRSLRAGDNPHYYLPLVVSGDGPTLTLVPTCAESGPTVTLNLVGANWPTDEGIDLFWDDSLQVKILSGHDGVFAQTWSESGIVTGTQENPTMYEVRAASDSYTVSASFSVPCAASLPTVTSTATPTITRTPTPDPTVPTLTLFPTCSAGSEATFDVVGFNWPTDEAIALYWDDLPQSTIPAGHGGSFSQTWTKTGLIVGTPEAPTVYEVRALSNTQMVTAVFYVPCPAPPTPTSTPIWSDLAIMGTPIIMATPPIVAYRPIDVALVVRNLGDPINSTFFVDVFFDPAGPITDTIPISQSVGYTAVASMESGETRIVQIHVPQGFANWPDPHLVYGVADSLQQIAESNEDNNVSPPSMLTYVTPAATPTSTPTQTSAGTISGMVLRQESFWGAQPRAIVALVDEGTGMTVQTTQSDMGGIYQFFNVSEGVYTLHACVNINGETYSGILVGISAPNEYADIYMLPGPCN